MNVQWDKFTLEIVFVYKSDVLTIIDHLITGFGCLLWNSIHEENHLKSFLELLWMKLSHVFQIWIVKSNSENAASASDSKLQGVPKKFIPTTRWTLLICFSLKK